MYYIVLKSLDRLICNCLTGSSTQSSRHEGWTDGREGGREEGKEEGKEKERKTEIPATRKTHFWRVRQGNVC